MSRALGDFHAGGLSGRPAEQAVALGVSDAAQLRFPARRIDDLDRHLAEHVDRDRAAGLEGTPLHVSFSRSPSAPRCPGSCSSVWLASDPGRAALHSSRRRVQDRGLPRASFQDRVGLSRCRRGTVAKLEDRPAATSLLLLSTRRSRRYVPGESWAVLPNDLLVVEADPRALEQFISDGKLEVIGSKELPEASEGGEVQGAEAKHEAALVPAELDPNRLATVEAVVTADLELIGHSAAILHLRERSGGDDGHQATMNSERRFGCARLKFQLGDGMRVPGTSAVVLRRLATLGCLPLAERRLRLRPAGQLLMPVADPRAGDGCGLGFGLVPAEISLLLRRRLRMLLGLLSSSSDAAVGDQPILIMIGALIPIGEAVLKHRNNDLLASLISGFAARSTGWWRFLPVIAAQWTMSGDADLRGAGTVPGHRSRLGRAPAEARVRIDPSGPWRLAPNEIFVRNGSRRYDTSLFIRLIWRMRHSGEYWEGGGDCRSRVDALFGQSSLSSSIPTIFAAALKHQN